MRHSSLAIAGVTLVVVGTIGLVAVFLLGGTALMSGPLRTGSSAYTSPDSLGEAIYLTGVGEDGSIPRSGGIGHMGTGGCVTCHGPNGQGGTVGMMASFEEAPPIAYSNLTGGHEEHGDEAEEEWTDLDIARAIRDGVLPDGDRLDRIMPRWDMNDNEMDALIEYLKTLDEE